jgi:hypothetical protein
LCKILTFLTKKAGKFLAKLFAAEFKAFSLSKIPKQVAPLPDIFAILASFFLIICFIYKNF